MTLKNRAAYLISEHNARRTGRRVPFWALMVMMLVAATMLSNFIAVATAAAKDFI